MNEEEKTVNNTYINTLIGSVFGPVEQHIEAAPCTDTKAAPDTAEPAAQTVDEAEAEAPTPLPEALRTPCAEALLARLVGAGLVDEGWQPLSLSGAEKGVLASLLAGRLDIATPWQTFGRLWGVKPETLRAACNKGMEQRRTGEFMRRVVKVMEGE